MATPPWASRNTGALTTLGAGTTGRPLAGDRLVDGAYQPIPIERIDDRTHQGYSAVLDLHLRWEDGRLGWYDPATGRHIPRFRDERDRANAEQEARIQAEASGRRKPAFRPKPGPGSSRRSSRDASNPEHLELRTGAAGICAARRLQPHSLGAEPGTVPGATGERRTFPHYPRFITSARRSARPFGLLLTGISGCLGA